MEVGSSWTFINFCQFAWFHIPEEYVSPYMWVWCALCVSPYKFWMNLLIFMKVVGDIFIWSREKWEVFTCCNYLLFDGNWLLTESGTFGVDKCVSKTSIRYLLCLGKAVFSDVKLKNMKQPLLDIVLTNLLLQHWRQNALSDRSWKYKSVFNSNFTLMSW
jgi:hypothetical protein